MFRRFVATLVAISTALAVAWPAHARFAADGATGPWDRCIGGKAVPSMPAGDAGTHAGCDRCCASGASLPPTVQDRTPLPAAHRDGVARTNRIDAVFRVALSPPARAPPRA